MSLSNEDMHSIFGPTSCSPDELKAMKSTIYFIVAYCKQDNKRRCFGYYKTLNNARESLQKTWKNMEECYYDSFLIESVEEGLHKIGSVIEYYEIETQERELVKKEIPWTLKNLVNWSIG